MPEANTETNSKPAAGQATKAPAEEGPRDFGRFLATLSNGEAISVLSYELHELGKRLQEEASSRSAKARGKLKLTINLSYDLSGAVSIIYAIDVQAPKKTTTPDVQWMTKGGNLVAENPRQQALPLRDVNAGQRETRTVDAPAAAKDIF